MGRFGSHRGSYPIVPGFKTSGLDTIQSFASVKGNYCPEKGGKIK